MSMARMWVWQSGFAGGLAFAALVHGYWMGCAVCVAVAVPALFEAKGVV